MIHQPMLRDPVIRRVNLPGLRDIYDRLVHEEALTTEEAERIMARHTAAAESVAAGGADAPDRAGP